MERKVSEVETWVETSAITSLFLVYTSYLSIRELQTEMFLSRTVGLQEHGRHPHCIWVRNPHSSSLGKIQKKQAVSQKYSMRNILHLHFFIT